MQETGGKDAAVVCDAEVIKSSAAVDLSPSLAPTFDGGLAWPVDPQALLFLYATNETHQRCIHLKASSGFGLGMENTSDAKGDEVSKIEALTDSGTGPLFEAIATDEGAFGNAYCQIVRSPVDRRPLRLRHLPGAYMQRTPTGGFQQVIRDAYGRTKKTKFAPDEVLHFRPACPMGGYYALPDWIGSSGMQELVQCAVKWNANFFKNGAIPDGILKVLGGTLADPQKQQAKEFFQRSFQGVDNAHRVLYLALSDKDAKIEFEKVGRDIKDGDFLKMMDSGQQRTHVAHGVPPRLLGIMTAGSLGGGGEVEGQMKQFETFTLEPKRRRYLSIMRPLLTELGIDRNAVRFARMDITSVTDDRERVTEWHREGLVDDDEARNLIGLDREGKSLDQGNLQQLVKALAEL